MTTDTIQTLIRTSARQVKETDCSIIRSLMQEIVWDDDLICIKGPRGTGKTTLMLQRIRKAFASNPDKAVYISLDNLFFSRYPVMEAVEYFHDHGYTHVFMDEVHYFGDDWQLLVKNLHDQFPGLNFVYSGSSMLKIDHAKGDLSRRQAIYLLNGLSFREFLHFEGVLEYEPLSLDDILSRHEKLALEITSSHRILPLFEKYLRTGYYPYYLKARGKYLERVQETILRVLENDYPSIESVSPETIRKTKKMLMVLASSTPQTPNMSRLYQELDTERVQGLKMLRALDSAGLVALLPSSRETLKNLSKPEKIYCDNTNIMHALTRHADIGVQRETFFYNQLRHVHEVSYSGTGDFLVDNQHIFEVGGPKKGYRQIRNLPQSYLAVDECETGHGNRIPLWLFGFLY